MKILRFWGATLAIVASGLLTCLWFQLDGERFGLTTDAQRLRASLVVAGVCLILLLAKEAFMPMWRKRQDTAQQPLRPSSGTRSQLEPARHAGLLSLCSELRVAHGPFWRYRLRWLMLHGNDLRIDEVAPGLKRMGVMHVGEVVLVHASPDGIDAKTWRHQIRQLRRRRPVDGLVHVTHADEPATGLPRTLATLATDLGWAAPVTFLHAVPAQGGRPSTFEAIGAFPGPALKGAQPSAALLDQLATIERHTADAGVRLCTTPARITYLAQISQYIGQRHEHIVTGWNALLASHWLRAPLAGVMFAPVFATSVTMPTPVPVAADGQADPGAATTEPAVTREPVVFQNQPASLLPAWRAIASRRGIGRRVGFFWPNALAMFVTVAAMVWCAWMTVSFLGNQQLMREARATMDAALDAQPQTAVAWRAQLSLQQLMEKLEHRQQHGAPWYLRGGLSRNDDVLAALWQPYRIAATRNLQAPVAQSIEHLLKAASAARADALQSQDTRGSTYDALKTYLMLGDPPRAEPAFLKRMLVTLWPHPVGMAEGERDDTGRRLAGFYADHLKAHPEWRIAPVDSLVNSSRNMLVAQIGLASADDTVYRSILDEAKGKYADASLETLLAGANARGLFKTSQTVPGLYTRAAWDGMIAEAIDRAVSERRAGGDWVLSGAAGADRRQPALAPQGDFLRGARDDPDRGGHRREARGRGAEGAPDGALLRRVHGRLAAHAQQPPVAAGGQPERRDRAIDAAG